MCYIGMCGCASMCARLRKQKIFKVYASITPCPVIYHIICDCICACMYAHTQRRGKKTRTNTQREHRRIHTCQCERRMENGGILEPCAHTSACLRNSHPKCLFYNPIYLCICLHEINHKELFLFLFAGYLFMYFLSPFQNLRLLWWRPPPPLSLPKLIIFPREVLFFFVCFFCLIRTLIN